MQAAEKRLTWGTTQIFALTKTGQPQILRKFKLFIAKSKPVWKMETEGGPKTVELFGI